MPPSKTTAVAEVIESSESQFSEMPSRPGIESTMAIQVNVASQGGGADGGLGPPSGGVWKDLEEEAEAIQTDLVQLQRDAEADCVVTLDDPDADLEARAHAAEAAARATMANVAVMDLRRKVLDSRSKALQVRALLRKNNPPVQINVGTHDGQHAPDGHKRAGGKGSVNLAILDILQKGQK